jgi:hypothetical protein
MPNFCLMVAAASQILGIRPSSESPGDEQISFVIPRKLSCGATDRHSVDEVPKWKQPSQPMRHLFLLLFVARLESQLFPKTRSECRKCVYCNQIDINMEPYTWAELAHTHLT